MFHPASNTMASIHKYQSEETPMQINPDINTSAYTVKSYDIGEVTVFEPISAENIQTANETGKPPIVDTLKLTRSSIIMTNKLVDDWAPQNPHLLKLEDFQRILDLRPEVVILGTGKNIHFPESKDMLLLQQEGIGIEVMGTAAACRTYNFLVSDGRKVACALFMIEE